MKWPHPCDLWVAGSYQRGAEHRAYKLFVPSAYRGEPLPLVVMLHGCTQDPDDFAAGTGMNELAQRVPFLALYPAQSESANPRRCWNWFRPEHQERDRGEPALIAGLTRHIMAQYCVDPEQVYVAGMSSGGAMAIILAITHPDLYAAVGVHSGLAYKAADNLFSALYAMRGGEPGRLVHDGPTLRGGRSLGGPAPLILFHGDDDQTVAVANAHRIVGQWAALNMRASAASDSALPGVPEAFVVRGCAPDGRAYTRLVFRTANSTVAEEWIVHSLGHAWSGGRANGSHTDPLGPSAAEQMLRFFLGRRLPQGLLHEGWGRYAETAGA